MPASSRLWLNAIDHLAQANKKVTKPPFRREEKPSWPVFDSNYSVSFCGMSDIFYMETQASRQIERFSPFFKKRNQPNCSYFVNPYPNVA
jgi:mRNA deadenylase 3'-5' endonuclease subunit Ccr4